MIFIQIGVPTRTDVEEYQDLRSTVNELVGKINGTFGTINHTPIKYLYCSLNFEDLVALYRSADVCIVTSTRDGMNLVSYEFIACQVSKKGVLILSEFAGAAKSMNGAIIVNPWNIEELVEAYHEAMVMDEMERASNHNKLFRYVTKYTAAKWGSSFANDLEKLELEYNTNDDKVLSPILPITLDLSISIKRLLFLDFDKGICGEILPYLGINVKSLIFLNEIRKNPNIILYLISARNHKELENLPEINEFGIISEQGCLVRLISEDRKWISNNPKLLPLSEENQIKSLFMEYSDSTPGSFFEINEFSANWFYHDKDSFYGSIQALELNRQISKYLKSDYKIVQKSGILSIIPKESNLTKVLRDVIDYHQKLDSHMENIFITSEICGSPNLFDFPNDKKMTMIKLNGFIYEDFQNLALVYENNIEERNDLEI